jgi:hypothetical protein
MSLSLPDYIRRTGIMDAPIVHTWDDADPEPAYLALDERLYNRIGKTSDRGVLALSAGFAEWVAWRLSKVSNDSTLFQIIEALWAGIIDWRYMKPLQRLDRKAYQGPARGPLLGAAKLLRRILDLTKRRQFAFPEAACLSYLDLYVMPDAKPFKDWRRFVIVRLATLYPRDKKDLLGAPVPREVLDPDSVYTPDMAPALLARFLTGLDPTKNPYLRTSAEMIQAGFEGVPYSM